MMFYDPFSQFDIPIVTTTPQQPTTCQCRSCATIPTMAFGLAETVVLGIILIIVLDEIFMFLEDVL